MKTWDDREQGQVLAQVALAMVVLLAFLALAVDVGQVYLKRRQLQNAADAGALEGARQMCFVPGQTYASAQAPARAEALLNAPEATVNFPPPPGPYEVAMTVQVVENIPSFVAGIVGQNDFDVGARATAVCGAADTVCGLFPVAFKESQWQLIENDCGKTFYLWASDQDDTGGGNQQPNCEECICDVDGDGEEDVISEEGRAWLDFTDTVEPLDPYADNCAESNGCGANELKCWVEESSAVRISLPTCIAGDTGVKAGVKNEIRDRADLGPPGNIVSVPIYTEKCGTDLKGNCSDGFYVTRLGCMEVQGWEQPAKLYEKIDPSKQCWNGKLIKVAVNCGGCNTYCGSTDGTTGPIPGGVNAVSLVE